MVALYNTRGGEREEGRRERKGACVARARVNVNARRDANEGSTSEESSQALGTRIYIYM